jgi:thermopsin
MGPVEADHPALRATNEIFPRRSDRRFRRTSTIINGVFGSNSYMTRFRLARGLAPLFIVVLLVASTLAVVGLGAASQGSGPTPAAAPPAAPVAPAPATGTHAIPTSTAQRVNELLSSLSANKVPSRDAYLPNFAPPVQMGPQGELIAPSYVSSPAPMGIADIGIGNGSGHQTAYSYRSSSFEGIANVTNASVFYLDSGQPYNFSIQLNAVLQGVTLFNHSTYVFWAQNVVSYSTLTHQLTFVDNLWNFSSPSVTFTRNSLFNSSGHVVPGQFYYKQGPTMSVSYPFTVYLFLNTTVLGDRPTVFFNYTLQSLAGQASGSYDTVVFNSTGYATPTAPASFPYWWVNGHLVTPTHFALNDAELVLGGPGTGSTTTFNTLNSSLSLEDFNATHGVYQTVPSAFDFGSNTGETAEGVTAYYTPGVVPVAHLGEGPSLPTPLWNESRPGGFERVMLHVQPANSFLFFCAGSPPFHYPYGWGPLPASGSGSYLMEPGNYTFEAMMSYHLTVTYNFTGNYTQTIVLPVHTTQGVYTPLIALDNQEVANISIGGAGTTSNPYVLMNYQPAALPVLFSEMNNYFFPVFPGILLTNTNVVVNANNSASFVYGFDPSYGSLLAKYSLPQINYLQIEFYHATNVSFWGSQTISGWFASKMLGAPIANVIFWGSNGDLIGNNKFSDEGSSLLLYNSTGDTVWGNDFISATPVANSTQFMINATTQVGLTSDSSGNLIYNNEFNVPVPAVTPTRDIVTGTPIQVHDTWNVSRQPASNVIIVNNYRLTGNILGLSYQGGNFWSNYGNTSDPYGTLPYNNAGLITFQGDYVPLTPSELFSVTFTEVGIPAGSSWNVTLNTYTQSTTGSSITFLQLNGSHIYTVGPPVGIGASPNGGVLTIRGANVTEALTFSGATQTVTFTESGLRQGSEWNVTFNSSSQASFGPSIAFVALAGTFPYSVVATGYTATPSGGNVTVQTSAITVPIVFTTSPGTLSGTITPATANLSVNGAVVSVDASSGAFNVSLQPGTYPVAATASGYFAYFNNVTLGSGGSTTLTITMDPQNAPPTTPGSLLGTLTPATAAMTVNGNTVSVASNGSFSVSGLGPGPVPVVVVATGYAPYFNNVTIASGQSTHVAITMVPSNGTIVQKTTTQSPFSTVLFWGLLVAGILIAIGIIVAALLSRRQPPSNQAVKEFRTETTKPTTAPVVATPAETTTTSSSTVTEADYKE